MIKLDVWQDKLPEDKAKYYNRTRMSIELFSQKLGLALQEVLRDFRQNGYHYNADKRLVEYVEKPPKKKLTYPKKTLQT